MAANILAAVTSQPGADLVTGLWAGAGLVTGLWAGPPRSRLSIPFINSCKWHQNERSAESQRLDTLRTGLFKLFKRPFPGFLTILTL